MSLRVVVEADGGSRGNPGPAGYGAVVFDAETRDVLAERSEAIGIATNNVAEYRGLIAGLQAAAELGATALAVRMDSKLVIEQMSGRWQVKHPAMKPLARQASALLRGFEHVTLDWIPRERNTYADRLANQAMDAAAGKPARAAAPHHAAAEAPAWSPPSGSPTRLILLRHGSTDHSPRRVYSGHNDLPLSEAGQREASALARRAATFGAVAAVVSSPLPRARQTADAVAAALGRQVEESESFVEADFGAWEGLTGGAVRERWPAEHAAWLTSPAASPPQGESFDDVVRRVRRARDELIRRHPGQTIAVVSHVTPIKTLLRLALEAPFAAMFRIHLDTASVSIVDYFDNGESSVRLVNDTSHLAG